MEQTLPMALQVALYAASGAIVVVAVVLILLALRLGRKLDRAVMAMERLEGELVPLVHRTRLLVDRLHAITATTADAVGGLLLPVRRVNQTIGLVQTGVVTFLRSFFNGPRAARFDAAAPGTPHNGDLRS